ncbi:MAG: hypothetical protein OXU22_04710, partial [Gammaproteobacteria bacterium]|nr:hypothetical protein [Gammaproteobacteria bacterium]
MPPAATATGGTLTIAHTSTSGDIVVTLLDDELNEAQETVTVTGASPALASLTRLRLTGTGSGGVQYTAGGNLAAVDVTDDDAISVSIAVAGTDADDSLGGHQVEESADATFTVTLDHASAADATIPYTIGGEVEADDYTDSGNGSLTIPAGDTEGTITVSLLADADTDAAEDLTVTLTAADAGPPVVAGPTVAAGGGDIAVTATTEAQSATASIIPYQGAHRFTLTRAPATIAETDVNADTTFTVARSGPDILNNQDLTLTYTVTVGSAAAADFSGARLPTGTVGFSGSQTSRTFDIGIAGDNLNEDGETFTIAFSIAPDDRSAATANSLVANGLPADHQVTITDDDPIEVTATATTGVTEGGNAVVNLNLASVPSRAITIDYSFDSNGSGIAATAATDDVDATSADLGATTPADHMITVAANTDPPTATYTIPVIADNLNEGAETFRVHTFADDISGAHGDATVAAGDELTFTIAASDPMTASISRAGASPPATVNEGASVDFTVTLSGATAGSAAEVTVPYSVGASGGYAPTDSGSGGLVIAAGRTEGLISIVMPLTNAFGTDDPDQTVTVTLTGDDAATDDTDEGPTAATGGGAVARTATAADQSAEVAVNFVDAAHVFEFSSPAAAITEGGGATYSVTRNGPSITAGATLSVTWAYAAGTPAPVAADFSGAAVPAGGVLAFTAAEDTKMFTVTT